jgi:hypothetical protein
VLPDGMTYSILVLPEKAHMRPEALAKIEALVKAGGTILGGPPKRSPSLQDYPRCDREILEIADRMWGSTHGQRMEKEIGKGYVLEGMSLQEALDLIGIPDDVRIKEDLPVLWTHRTMPGMEIYFLTNQGEEILEFAPSFDVSGLEPQLWDAVTGEIRKLNDYEDDGSRTRVRLTLQKHESCFVVFTSQSNSNTTAGYTHNSPEIKTLTFIDSEWTLEFWNKEFGLFEPLQLTHLLDWTGSTDKKMKYYSGTATYKTVFTLEELPSGETFLNLGEVGVMARVILNGSDLGVSWMAPFRLNTKDRLITGRNQLEVEVVNVWRNRMVGDLELPERERYTTTTFSILQKGEKLTPSGLLGPVSIEWIPSCKIHSGAATVCLHTPE